MIKHILCREKQRERKPHPFLQGAHLLCGPFSSSQVAVVVLSLHRRQCVHLRSRCGLTDPRSLPTLLGAGEELYGLSSWVKQVCPPEANFTGQGNPGWEAVWWVKGWTGKGSLCSIPTSRLFLRMSSDQQCVIEKLLIQASSPHQGVRVRKAKKQLSTWCETYRTAWSPQEPLRQMGTHTGT